MRNKITFIAFLILEITLYPLILKTGNMWIMFTSIVLCFLFSIMHIRTGDPYIPVALGFTVAADFFLVLCGSDWRVWGMAFFLCVQSVYAIRLQRRKPSRPFLFIRIILSILSIILCITILGKSTDVLAIISIGYYANLLISIIEGYAQFRNNRWFPIGMTLFLLCDTVIGLQALFSGYLTVSLSPVLASILYPNFNLAWLFYLPSQVILSLSTILGDKKEEV